MNKFGFFIQTPGAGLDLIEQYKPTAVLLMDAESRHIAQVREVSPNTTILYWMHEGGKDWRTTDPEWWAGQIWDKVSENPPDITTYWNEPLWQGDYASFPEFDARQAEFIRVMRSHGVRVGAFRFAEGNFTQDGPRLDEYFPESVEELDCIFINEYWFPHYWSDGMQGWHCARWPYWLQWLEEVGKIDIDVYITECGVTDAITGAGPDEGWMGQIAKESGVTDKTYLQGLREYHELCCQYPQVKAVLPFIWYPWPGQWGTFRHDNRPEIYGPIMEMDAPGPTNGGNDMLTVYDLEGNALTGAVAEEEMAKYGVAISPPPGLQDGDHYYQITKLWIKTGYASFVSTVKDIDGTPVVNPQETLDLAKPHRAFWWTDAPELDPQYSTDREDRADVGGLDENGAGGSGMGTGAYTDYYQDPWEGPHRAWIRDPNLPSDELVGIRMIGMTNHDHPDALWEEKIYRGTTPPPDGHAARLHEIADEIHSIADDLGPGGISQIVVEYSSGETEIFKPVVSAVSSIINLVRRIVK